MDDGVIGRWVAMVVLCFLCCVSGAVWVCACGEEANNIRCVVVSEKNRKRKNNIRCVKKLCKEYFYNIPNAVHLGGIFIYYLYC